MPKQAIQRPHSHKHGVMPAAAARQATRMLGMLACGLALALAQTAALAASGDADSVRIGTDASVQDIIDGLTASLPGPRSRSFTMTAPPDVTSNQCAPVVVGTQRSASEAASAQNAAQSRNLTVVPYNPDNAPGVHLEIQFELDSDALTSRDQELLRKLAEAVNAENLRLERFAVAGHTDRIGPDHRNLQLSCARARAVVRFLMAHAVDGSRMTPYGFGSSRPLRLGMPDRSPENRRVEIRIAD